MAETRFDSYLPSQLLRTVVLVIFTTLIFSTVHAQTGSTVSGELKGFVFIRNQAQLILKRYDGLNYIGYDTVSADNEGRFKFNKKLVEGFYELTVPEQGISRPIYCNGKKDASVTISNTDFQTDQVKFSDNENQALSELLAASKHLEISLNTLTEQFNPRQIDSFYLKRIVSYNIKVQEAYRNFNKEIGRLKTNYPGTLVMDVFSSFYQLPLFDEDVQRGHFYDNQDAYMRDHFFDLWKLDDARVIQLPEIKSKIESYFRYFSKRDQEFLLSKCDDILNLTKNEKVKRHLASLLIEFFSGVKEEEVVAHVVENGLHGCLDGIDKNLVGFNHSNLRGSKVTELILPSANQQVINLADVYSSSKVTILYFWTSGCIHCKQLHPVIKKLKDKYPDGLGIYRVCLEDDKEKWNNASKEFSLNQNNTIASGEKRKQVSQTFNIKYTPMIYILNKSGEILDKGVTGEDLEKTLRGYF